MDALRALNTPPSRLIALPTMPTLREESRLGYDVKVPMKSITLFWQFKVPSYITSTMAAEVIAGTRTVLPYYRFPIKTKMAGGFVQHNALLDLNAKPGHVVQYVAPLFYKMTSFDHTVRHGQTYRQALYLPPTILPRVKPGDPHCVTYRTRRDAKVHSLSRQIYPLSWPDVMNECMAELEGAEERSLADTVHSLAESLSKTLDESAGSHEEESLETPFIPAYDAPSREFPVAAAPLPEPEIPFRPLEDEPQLPWQPLNLEADQMDQFRSDLDRVSRAARRLSTLPVMVVMLP